MTYERYVEILSHPSTPQCTAEQLAALKSFVPRWTPMSAAVRFALMGWGTELKVS